MNEHFTEAQMDAVKHAFQLLHEHFDVSIIGVMAVNGMPPKEGTQVFFSGGRLSARGLLREMEDLMRSGKVQTTYEDG